MLVIVTDLDGTLLDAERYTLGAAASTVERVIRSGVPLVFCSSKTRVEIERLQAALGLDQPFIVENGGAVHLPSGWKGRPGASGLGVAGRTIVLGSPYRDVVAALGRASRATGVTVQGFASMRVEEVAEACQLSASEAQDAQAREFDEVFRILDGTADQRQALAEALASDDVRVTRGGRFWHATGGTDKGRAVGALRRLVAGRDDLIVGLGDAPNDVSLLTAVDVPIVVRNPAVRLEAVVDAVPTAQVTSAIGPAGWAEAVTGVLDRWSSRTSRP